MHEVSKKSNDTQMGLLLGPLYDPSISMSLLSIYICIPIYIEREICFGMSTFVCATACDRDTKIGPPNSCSLRPAIKTKVRFYVFYIYIYIYIYVHNSSNNNNDSPTPPGPLAGGPIPGAALAYCLLPETRIN